jgi:hypothetical protein
MAPVPTAGVDFRDLLRSGQFSDLTVVCRGIEFKLHKVIACLQSPVFLAAVNSDFQVRSREDRVERERERERERNERHRRGCV